MALVVAAGCSERERSKPGPDDRPTARAAPPVEFCGKTYPRETEQVHCSADGPTDLAPLRGLPRLRALDLVGPLADPRQLGSLAGLRVLGLTQPGLRDLEPLAGLALDELYLDSRITVDLRALPRTLRVFELRVAEPVDLAPLRGLPELRRLLLDDAGADPTAVAALVSLQELVLVRPAVELSLLSRLTQLRELDLGIYEGADLAPLRALTQLRRVSMPTRHIDDIAPLASLTQLEELEAPLGSFTDVRPLATLTHLRVLDLEHVGFLRDLAPLAQLTSLEELNVGHTMVEDLRPLAALTKLRRLRIDYTMVHDLAPLAALTTLEELDVTCTPAPDLMPLARLPRLRKIRSACVGAGTLDGEAAFARARPDVTLEP